MADFRICSVDGCGKPRYKRQFCNAHYIRWRRHGDPTAGGASPIKAGGHCGVASCAIPATKHGYCNAHYLKLRRHGDPLVGKSRPPGPFRREWLNKHALPWGDKDQCLIFPFSLSPNGYGQATGEDGDPTGAHRYVCEAEHGPPPSPEHETAHSCGNRCCVNRWHLRWATREENAADKLLHGTDGRGEKNPKAKLTRPEVDEIIRLRGIETGVSLAERFGVTPAQISNIQLGKQWTYDT